MGKKAKPHERKTQLIEQMIEVHLEGARRSEDKHRAESESKRRQEARFARIARSRFTT